jgi:hypothetical protein
MLIDLNHSSKLCIENLLKTSFSVIGFREIGDFSSENEAVIFKAF